MSTIGESIECRKCKEVISLEGENCPHCGTGIRSTGKLIAIAAVGGVIALSSFWNVDQLWFFGFLGVAISAVAGLLFHDKRQRMRRAAAT